MGSAKRAAWVFAWTGLAALVFSSSAAYSGCINNSPVNVFASSPPGCSVSGNYQTGVGGPIAVRATTGGLIDWTNGEGVGLISTVAAATPAAQADLGGSVTLAPSPFSGFVTTSGASSPGLLVTDPGSTITTSFVAVETDASGPSADAFGVLVQNGGIATLSGGTVLTFGNGSTGLEVNGAGSRLTASALVVKTNGANAFGAFNGGAPAESPIATMDLTNVQIVTLGGGATGVVANGGGVTTLSGGSVNTSGVNGIGLHASGEGSSITTSSGTTVLTGGTSSHGVQADSGGAVTLGGGSVTTTGQDAFGLYATDAGSQISATNVTVSTTGDGAIGIYATAVGVVTGHGLATISTLGTNSESGPSAYGVNANGSRIDLAAATITTAGQGAVGLYASVPFDTDIPIGGTIVVSGPLSVTTGAAPFAYGAWAQGAGSTIALNGPSTFTINGAAYALYATQGGSISASNTLGIVVNGDNGGGVQASDAGSSATLKGATTITLNGSADNALLAVAGGAISTQGPIAINVLGSHSVGVGAFSSAITASGPVNITTSQISSTAFALSGVSPTIAATGGGTVSAAGKAIEFVGASNAVATFDNFTIGNRTGDLIFADPSVATINFNNTVANAGTNNLLNATGGSIVTLNASASTLTGAIATDASSTSSVSLTNGSMWNLTGSSTVSNLGVVNSAVVFAPPGSGGGFKTLTVGNYVGSGANMTLNTMLGGSSSPTDQIIVKGGSATGSTLVTIHNAGGLGAQTTGAGIPIVVTTSGGTTSSNAFALANTPVVSGYRYTLNEANQDWYLVSSPTSTASDVARSINNPSWPSQIIANRILTSILLGATEQVNCTNCSSGFGAIGSFALGAHGRWSLSDRLTVMGGFSYSQYSAGGVKVYNAPTLAGSLVYDLVDWGHSRPFFEIGGGVTPYSDAHYDRHYANGLTTGFGSATAVDRNAAIFGRVGWVARLTPIDEAAVYADLSRNWMQTGGYTEATNALNPFPASVATGVDSLNIARIGAQHTHLFASNFEVNVSGGYAYGFGATSGSQIAVLNFGTISPFPVSNSGWVEYGVRVGYRMSQRMVVDAFAVGTLGGQPAGNTIHGGVGLRYLF